MVIKGFLGNLSELTHRVKISQLKDQVLSFQEKLIFTVYPAWALRFSVFTVIIIIM